MSTAADLGEVWLATVEAQLAAARGVDAAALGEATRRRVEVQAALVDQFVGLDAEARRRLAAVAARVRSLDLRIHRCGTLVISALGTFQPAPPPTTYTRHARIREAG